MGRNLVGLFFYVGARRVPIYGGFARRGKSDIECADSA